MSVIRCDECDRYIDTDYDVEDTWECDKFDGGVGFICGLCTEKLEMDQQTEDRP